MARPQPKVLLFDIGGVCVVSPFQTILDYELSLGIPPGWVNYSISQSGPNGFWQKIEKGDIPMDKHFFEGFTKDLHNPGRWRTFYQREQQKNPELPQEVPEVPTVDGERLFNEMMTASEHPDPWMMPALKKLKDSGKYILAALSNTVIFPPGHPLYRADFFSDPVRSQFDVFISSAHVHLRKPDSEMYQFAVKKLDEYAKANAASSRAQGLGWSEGVQAREILFLDDIGANLKGAKREGFATIKVPLGRTYEAVEELENITGMTLAGDHPKIPVKPKYPERRSKL